MPSDTSEVGRPPPAGDGAGGTFERRVRAFLDAEAQPFLDEAATAPGGPSGTGDGELPGLSDSSADHQARQIDAARRWQRTVFDHGLAWIDGPPAYGGAGLGAEEADLYRRIEADFDVPDRGGLLVGLHIVAPVIAEHGTEQQRAELLRPLLRADVFACLLLSEPGTGSDLGALTTKAVRDGDEWQIDGQKGWGSYAQFSDAALLLARTDPEAAKERGLTVFVIDMHQPGIEVHPTRHMTGGAHFSDVFLSGVRVPDGRRIGGVGDGWRVTASALRNERGAAGASHDSPPGELVRRLARLWAETDASPATRAAHRGAVTSAAALGRVLELTNQRLRPAPVGRPGLETSITKLLRNQFLAAAVDGGCAVAGPGAAADNGAGGGYAWGRARVAVPGFRLAGGSDEIQRNLLAERVLGLPREPRA